MLRYARAEGQGRAGLTRYSEPQLTRYADELRRTAEACGCDEGAVGVWLALGLWASWFSMVRRPRTTAEWRTVLRGIFPVGMAGALTFKFGGIARARRRHERLRAELFQAG